MVRSCRFFLILVCIFSLTKVSASEQRSVLDLNDLLFAIDGAPTDLEKVKAVRTFLVSQSTEWVSSENCRLANNSRGRQRSQESWSLKINWLHLENNPQSENAVRALKIYRDFLTLPKEQRTFSQREILNQLLDEIPLDPVPNCNDSARPLDYSKLSEEHNRILVLTRISLGRDVWDTYLKSYWTRRGRLEVFQKLISCQEEFKDLLGANLFCFTNLTNELNPKVQNRALNYLQEAGLLSILLDRNPFRPCLKKNLDLFLDQGEYFNIGSIFSPIHNVTDAHALKMRFACN